MTDKQIIIDGVPVQDCCYFDYENNGYKDSCYIHQNECSAQNCYYKQLKRKEQECERLKEILKDKTDEHNKLAVNYDAYVSMANEQLDQLKAENDYLKHKIFRYEEIFKHSADMIKNPVTAIEVETFQSGVKALGNSLIAEENNKLHKTLTEIKEIAEDFGFNGTYESYKTAIDQILQKISECEV